MASPEPPSILSSSLISSPMPIRPSSEHSQSHSPVRPRRSNGDLADRDTSASRPRLSPTLTRSYNPNDPDMRERQRTMDADMAMQLSRARSNTVVSTISPNVSPIAPVPRPLSTVSDTPVQFPALSLQEEQAMTEARGRPHAVSDPDNVNAEHYHPGPAPDVHLNHLSAAHDPSLLVSLDTNDPEGGLPMYQASVGPTSASPPERQEHDFSPMEAFAREEKARLGLQTPGSLLGVVGGTSFGRPPAAQPQSPGEPDASPSASTLFTIPRARHRKLSQSERAPRRGKLALFEQPGAAPPTSGTTLSAVPSYENLNDIINGTPAGAGVGMGGHGLSGGPGSGHDRPYRFSFYSNALSATIHARSLSELPAEGQSFEDLFLGRTPATNVNPTRPGMNVRMGTNGSSITSPVLGIRSGVTSPAFNPVAFGALSGKQSNGGGRGIGDGSGESCTWWLDVLSPTDEEMKLLSKVFSIHPLTTEDIQMEETREKIELFRNYYLVCFRGFDQDPYSPTYLEPLNMYIIVFREGILSFHFRPTPHPQNVRRRIKQLKDYISVTSDWISYALIDDITDAFGPLIQSIEYEVDSIDELVLILKEAEQSDMLRRIGTCRKKVMGLLRLMGNKADVVKGLAKRCNENWRVAPTSDIGLYLSDIQDHLITMTQNLNHYEKILSRSHSNYLAQISIEMTEANNQINDVLSKLTALGTVLIPMNLVTGLWGMNVHVPGQDVVEGYAWFSAIIGALAAFAVLAGWSTYKLMVRR
ncbi:uncharacterized protein FIBRA_02459 [Fibroporia radiculosa]|uniref:Cora-domain-containing protein n=1 Tax=Fibroporia radiculosa TaxID=599839 RepID=J4HUZ5_9APHY|nr:uncharacterized protein FIBRA_02459 [Fibroporia radiculosa]CCM00427.1 predicted protein [Fibroporia radiculosa]